MYQELYNHHVMKDKKYYYLSRDNGNRQYLCINIVSHTKHFFLHFFHL